MTMKGKLMCSLLSVAAVGLVAALALLALKQPGVSEAALRRLVAVGGIPESVFDMIEVKDDVVWYDVITKGNLGLAEAYMHGRVSLDPKELFTMIVNGTSVGTRRAEGNDYFKLAMDLVAMPAALAGRLFNQQTTDKSRRVAEQHYDVGNDLYEAMLGPTMSYTCAYWKNAENLEDAQKAKFELIRGKLEFSEGMKVVDLGMGWGTAAAYMQAESRVSVTGVTLSKEQHKWATDNLLKPGLRFLLQDYRELCEDPEHQGKYDRAYSIGMLEHVGYQNHGAFFKCLKNLLKPEGLAVVHTIGEPDFVPVSDPFLDKYIFPGAVIPTLSSLTAEFENSFILEDFQNFGYDYAKTLDAWSANSKKFFAANPKAYSPEFQRMWEYYLRMCEVLFELRINQLWHFVLSPRPAGRKRIDRKI